MDGVVVIVALAEIGSDPWWWGWMWTAPILVAVGLARLQLRWNREDAAHPPLVVSEETMDRLQDLIDAAAYNTMRIAHELERAAVVADIDARQAEIRRRMGL